MHILKLFLPLFIFHTAFAEPTTHESLVGEWEGFFSGPPNNIGYMRLSISSDNCSMLHVGDKLLSGTTPEIIKFPCGSVIKENAQYHLILRDAFPDNSGFIELRLIFGLVEGSTKLVKDHINGSINHFSYSTKDTKYTMYGSSSFVLNETRGDGMPEQIYKLLTKNANKKRNKDSGANASSPVR
jgi:hypothetical protein